VKIAFQSALMRGTSIASKYAGIALMSVFYAQDFRQGVQISVYMLCAKKFAAPVQRNVKSMQPTICVARNALLPASVAQKLATRWLSLDFKNQDLACHRSH